MIVHHEVPEKCKVLKDQADEGLRAKANRHFSATRGPEIQANAVFRKERILLSRATVHSNPNPKVRISSIGASTTSTSISLKGGWGSLWTQSESKRPTFT